MLSLFPELFDWSWYVPFVFRMFLAFYFIGAGYHLHKKSREDQLAWTTMGALIALVGIAFFVGISIQIAGAVGFALAMIALYFKQKHKLFAPESEKFYLLVGLVALSLVFLGPGIYAIDLPL